MTTLYIANCSKQDHIFHYHLPGNPQPFAQRIRAGAQIKIDCREGETDAIINQHVIYGMQDVARVKKGFSGLAYRLDKPISVDMIQQGFEQKDAEMIERALESRKVGAAATDAIIAGKAAEFGHNITAPTEVTVTEEGKGPAGAQAGGFDETIKVVRDDAPPPPVRHGRRRA
jgi:hypothetical protein